MINEFVWVVCGPSRAGKTTLINEVASITNLIAIDMDAIVAAAYNFNTVQSCYNHLGEEQFRQLELKTYQAFSPKAGHIIALGGGALLNAKIFSLTQQWGVAGVIEHTKPEILQRWSMSSPANIKNIEFAYNIREKACSLWSKQIWSNNANVFVEQITKIAGDIKSGN